MEIWKWNKSMGNGKHMFSQSVKRQQSDSKSRYRLQWFQYSQLVIYNKKQNVSASRGRWYRRSIRRWF